MNSVPIDLDREVFKRLYNKFFDKTLTKDEAKQFQNLLDRVISISIEKQKYSDADYLINLLNVVNMYIEGKIRLDKMDVKISNV